MIKESYISREDIEALKASDTRWRDIEIMVRVEEEIRDSAVLNLLLRAAARRADSALEKLVDVDPTDTRRVASYQAEVQCARFIAETLAQVRENGCNAMTSLEEERELAANGLKESHGQEEENR